MRKKQTFLFLPFFAFCFTIFKTSMQIWKWTHWKCSNWRAPKRLMHMVTGWKDKYRWYGGWHITSGIQLLDLAPTGKGVTDSWDDNNVGPFQLGFSLRYYYYNVSRIRIYQNGYLLFESGSGCKYKSVEFRIPTIPLATVLIVILQLWIDLIFGVAAQPGKCYIYRNNVDSCIIGLRMTYHLAVTAPVITTIHSKSFY